MKARSRLRSFWARHRTLFWSLHSLWALATGVVVMVLARERYGFVPWVVVFLSLTWVSTLVFGRRMARASSDGTGADRSDGLDPVPGVGEEAASYVTRTLYQETLFFLLPFYAYSTVVGSPNVLFLGLLGALALLSCLDLVFDRLLRTRPVFSLVFFATVAFAAINLLLPMLFRVGPTVATTIAAGVAVLSAAPLSLHPGSGPKTKAYTAMAGAAFLFVAVVFPATIPPVPLRLDQATFAPDLDRASLEPRGVLEARATQAEVGEVLFVVLEVFAPSSVPTSVSIEWTRDGTPVRTSRDIGITAHEAGFRVWDSWRDPAGLTAAGRYRVTIRTEDGRVFGRAGLEVS